MILIFWYKVVVRESLGFNIGITLILFSALLERDLAVCIDSEGRQHCPELYLIGT